MIPGEPMNPLASVSGVTWLLLVRLFESGDCCVMLLAIA
jgi:hypothetical protein